MFELPAPPGAAIDVRQVAAAMKYQPFRFSDGAVTGVGANYVYGSALRIARKTEVGEEEFSRFEAANRKLAAMYEFFIEEAVAAVGGSMNGLTYCDFACNGGYFVYRMAQRGATDAVGVDVLNMEDAFSYANAALGIAPGTFERRIIS